MKVLNVHSRVLACSIDGASELIDSLASFDDVLWPRHSWPPMKFDRPLQVGAVGGHGPILYTVESYEPGRAVRFRFTGPRGFDGYHELHLTAAAASTVQIQHTLSMATSGVATITWPLVYRPLHDALIEDAFDLAQKHASGQVVGQRWPARVRLLRRLLELLRSARTPKPKNAT